jgi:hypothetical protein
MMWLFSVVPADQEDETAVEMHSSEALYAAVEILRHAIRTEDQ